MAKKLIMLSLLFLILACASNKNSQFIKNEVTAIELNEKPEISSAVGGISLAILIPKVVDWGIPKIKTAFDKEVKKYKAEYKSKIYADDFYIDRSSDTIVSAKLKYEGFTVHRIIALPDKPNDTVATIKLDFIENKSQKFLALKPTYILVNKSKAKLKANDNALDLIIDVKLNSSWIDKKQEHQSKEIANVKFDLKNIKLGTKYYHTNKELSNTQSNWFAPVPVSLDANGNVIGNGNFGLEINVTELDDYGERIEKYSKEIENNESSIKELLKKLFE